MTRIIRIESCDQCRSRDHKGGFARVAYVPVCRAAGRELPYTPHIGIGGMITASQTPGIPEWCPLEKANDANS